MGIIIFLFWYQPKNIFSSGIDVVSSSSLIPLMYLHEVKQWATFVKEQPGLVSKNVLVHGKFTRCESRMMRKLFSKNYFCISFPSPRAI